jgi:hypothetical protein
VSVRLALPLASLKARAVSPFRRGPRTVIWTPEGIGLGNFLYLWMAAFTRQRASEDWRVLHTPAMDPWLNEFPRVSASLLVKRFEVKLRDRRDLGWHQRYGIHFTREDLESFLQEFVTSARPKRTSDPQVAGELVINVRRGDYYTVPKFRGLYSFDTVAYVRRALEMSCDQEGVPTKVRIVSDDIAWCKSRLDWVSSYAPVEFSAGSPQADFWRLATTRRLILANSTFSYWGAYASNVIHEGHHGSVFAPRFHRRDLNGGMAWQLDPRWSIIEDIDGGWDS